MIVTLRRNGIALSHHESLADALRVVAAIDGPERRVITAIAPFTFLSICSGIEAASVAWKPLGWRPLGFAEIEKFPAAVLRHHYPDVPNHGDFTKIDARRYRGRVDILCGGTPCQAFSVAGARNSLDDVRGNLTLAFVDLAHAINPRNVVWENVPGVLSTHDNAFGCFLAGLVGAPDALVPIAPRPADGKSNRNWGWSAKQRTHYIKWPRAGMVAGPKGRAAWTIKDAQYFGLAQRRERVLVIADFGSGADPAAVLFEPEGVRRHSPPSREAGQGIAPTISARTKGGGGLGTDFDLDGGLRVVSRPLLTKGNDSFDETNDLAPTLRAGGHTGSHANAGVMPAIAYGFQPRIARNGRGDIGDLVAALNAQSGETGKGDAAPCVALSSAVRRLTPRECERLQGFQFLCSPTYPGAWQDDAGRWWSPDYTAIPKAADGPRYKSLGNSWAVPKFRWLGRRIQALMPR